MSIAIHPTMRYIIPALLAGACLALPPAAALAQTESIGAAIVIADPPASCSVSTSDDLDFGVIIRPSSGSGQWVDISNTSGSVSTSSGISNPASHSVGYARMRAINVTTMTVERTFPADLDGLTFAGDWAVSGSANSGYSAISGASDTQSSLGGVGGDATRHYRFGGRVTGIGSTTSLGTYDDTINITISCTQ